MKEAIEKAKAWREAHREHVERLESEATACYAPCGEDLLQPQLWKPASWVWLKIVKASEPCYLNGYGYKRIESEKTLSRVAQQHYEASDEKSFKDMW